MTEEAFDFHIHTVFSDGLREPRDALDLAAKADLAGIAITDHDTVSAYEEIGDWKARGAGPRILPGIEVSAARDDVEIHILGYFPAGLPAGIRRLVGRLLAERTSRMRDGLRRLGEKGVDIGWSEVVAEAGKGVVSRGHLAQILVRKHYVPNIYAAFPDLLGPEVVRPPEIDVREAIAEIRELGGIAVWAHPSMEGLDSFLDDLVGHGLSGIELYTPHRRASERRSMERRISGKKLLVTGGSDWHGGAEEKLGRFKVGRPAVGEFLDAIGW